MLNDSILEIADNVQQIEFLRNGSGLRHTVDSALKRKSTIPEQRQFFKPVLQCWARWYLHSQQMPVSPKRGDEIVDSENRHWIIYETRLSESTRSWYCLAYYFDVHFELDDYIDLFHFDPGVDQSGVQESSWVLHQTGIPAKFAGVRKIREEKKSPEKQYVTDIQKTQTLLLRGPVEFDPYDRIRHADGTYYQIRRIQYPEFNSGWIIVDTTKIS